MVYRGFKASYLKPCVKTMERGSMAASGTREEPEQRLAAGGVRVCFWAHGGWGKWEQNEREKKQWAPV